MYMDTVRTVYLKIDGEDVALDAFVKGDVEYSRLDDSHYLSSVDDFRLVDEDGIDVTKKYDDWFDEITDQVFEMEMDEIGARWHYN